MDDGFAAASVCGHRGRDRLDHGGGEKTVYGPTQFEPEHPGTGGGAGHYPVRARGVAPTQSGEGFLGYARSILAQMDSLEAMFRPRREPDSGLFVTAPRASYVARAYARCLREHGHAPISARYREAPASGVISDVASGAARLGVARWQAEHAAALDSLLRENALSGETLWDFSMVVVMHESHPLAALPEIPYRILGDYPELVHGDLTPVMPPESTQPPQAGHLSYVAVFDRGAQFDLLRDLPGSYMWVSPVPFAVLAQHGLVQKPCRSGTRYRDVLVRRRSVALSAMETDFLSELRRETAALAQP